MIEMSIGKFVFLIVSLVAYVWAIAYSKTVESMNPEHSWTDCAAIVVIAVGTTLGSLITIGWIVKLW
jgi:hypothetical protein